MLLPIVIAGITLGAAGSLHCIGMCGPLSLALPTRHLGNNLRLLYLLIYQLGRILTYTILGCLFGIAGKGIFLSGYQQAFSITAGAVVLVLAISYTIRKRVLKLNFLQGFYVFISQATGRLLRSVRSAPGFFLFGMANGLLPCGMVYVAVLAAFSFGDLLHSAVFMAMFGAGTLPAMMLVALAGQRMGWKAGFWFRKLSPFFMITIGVLMILRGMQLNIPYLSPLLQGQIGEAVSCHP